MDTIDAAVGARIRARRKDKGLTQDKLAKMLNITFQQLQKYERGINRVSASRLHALSEALDVTPAYFFDVPAFPQGESNEVLDLFAMIEGDDECQRLNKAFRRIRDATLRKAIITLVDTAARVSRA